MFTSRVFCKSTSQVLGSLRKIIGLIAKLLFANFFLVLLFFFFAMSAQSVSPLDDSAEWAALKSRSPTLSLLQGKPSEGEPGGFLPPPQALPSVPVVRVFYLSTAVGVDICGGRVGSNGNRFCTNICATNSTVCGQFASHSRKAVVIPSSYYVMSERGSSAFIEPSLSVPVSGFAPEVLDVMTGERSVSEWVHIFAQLQSIGEMETENQLDILNRVEKRIVPGPTPMKMGQRAPPFAFEARLRSVAEPDSWSEVSGTELEAALLPAGGDFVTHAGAHWNLLVRAFQSFMRQSTDMEGSVKGLLEDVDDKIVMVSASLGKPTISATTAWSAIGSHETLLEKISIESLEQFKSEMRSRLSTADVRVDELNTKIREGVFPIVQDVFNRLEIVSGKVEAGVYSSGHQSGISTPNLHTMIDMIEKLHAEHKVLEEKLEALSPTRNLDETSMQAVIVQLSTEVDTLKEEIAQMRMEMQTDSLSFGGHFFPTLESVEKFVLINVSSGYYGFCYDFISLLECYSDRNRDSDEGLNQKHKMGKAGYTDSASARIDQSFGCVVPMIFGKDEEANNPAKKLTALTSALIWENNRSGIKVNIDKFVTNHRRTIESQISRMFGSSSKATLFFQQMLHKTEVFWNSLSAWVNKFEKDMSAQYGCGNRIKHQESVWNLICWIIHSMFLEMNIRRADGSAISTTTQDGTKKCASILQGALGAHKFMSELIDAGFIRHPIFSATMHEFLLANKAPNDAIEELVSRMTKLEKENRSAQSSQDRRRKDEAPKATERVANK